VPVFGEAGLNLGGQVHGAGAAAGAGRLWRYSNTN
jgi:hypothetical protein